MIVPARRVPPKDSQTIASEWDAVAERRHEQILSGRDLSFSHILRPTTISLLADCDVSRVLDVGCGTGDLTRGIAGVCELVLGVDVSQKSIQLAREYSADLNNVSFLSTPLEEFSGTQDFAEFSTVVAGMTLMTVQDLGRFANALARVLIPNGQFVATLAHPCFWPTYWGYAESEWFEYKEEVFIEAPFWISEDHTDFLTTHVHRPLDRYLGVFASMGLCLDQVMEPWPSAQVETLYPERWRFPRFIGLRWTKRA